MHRFRAVVALSLVGLTAGAAAGCDSSAARWAEPRQAASTAPAGDGANTGAGTADDPPPSRRNNLQAGARTLYFLEGVLPAAEADGTTAALGGALALRAQCHDGTLTVRVTAPGAAGAEDIRVTCDGRPHQRSLGSVRAGDTLSVELTGKKGTDFAIELAAN